MTRNESHWYKVYDGLAYWVYAKPGSKSTGSLNIKNYTKIAINSEYIRKISSIRYNIKVEDMIKTKTW